MAEEKRDNPYPYPTATDVAGAPGDRETKATRNVMSRNIWGLAKRAFVLGQNDHAPVHTGVKDLVTICYKLLDNIAESECSGLLGNEPDDLRELLEDHRCPDTPPIETNVG